MFEVDIYVPDIMFNDNESAVNNSSMVESIINRKHISISYDLVC